MKDTLQRIPKLRFPGFSGEWEISEIEDHFIFKNGLNKEKKYFGKGTPIINFTDVFNLNAICRSDVKGLVELTPKEINNFSAKKGDVFFTRTSETINDIGMSATLVEDIENCVFSGFVLRARPKNDQLDNIFKSYCFNIEPVRKEIITKSSYTTRALTSGTLLNKVIFKYPKDKKEQQKIAAFLTAVDQKLTQLERKKTLLEQYKKGVMQQLFSQQIRFKPDSKEASVAEPGRSYPDWEEKKLGEIGETFNGLSGKTKEHFGKGKPYIQYKQIFYSSKIDVSKCDFVEISENEKQSKVQFGDVFFTTSSETPGEIGTSSVLLDEVSEMYLNSFCFGYRFNLEILNPSFAQFLFRSEVFRKKIIRLAQGSTRYNMSKTQLLKLTINLPCLEEQTKIAAFLSGIDKKIASVNTQLENTRQFKKGLLQQMFV